MKFFTFNGENYSIKRKTGKIFLYQNTEKIISVQKKGNISYICFFKNKKLFFITNSDKLIQDKIMDIKWHKSTLKKKSLSKEKLKKLESILEQKKFSSPRYLITLYHTLKTKFEEKKISFYAPFFFTEILYPKDDYIPYAYYEEKMVFIKKENGPSFIGLPQRSKTKKTVFKYSKKFHHLSYWTDLEEENLIPCFIEPKEYFKLIFSENTYHEKIKDYLYSHKKNLNLPILENIEDLITEENRIKSQKFNNFFCGLIPKKEISPNDLKDALSLLAHEKNKNLILRTYKNDSIEIENYDILALPNGELIKENALIQTLKDYFHFIFIPDEITPSLDKYLIEGYLYLDIQKKEMTQHEKIKKKKSYKTFYNTLASKNK